jgi:23S rRNA (adenine2503-C2)-methyltransferase
MQLIDQVSSKVEDVQKFVYKNDKDVLEVSYIRKGDGKDILCVPTQTSCNMDCTFCHLTPLNIKAVNLEPEQIVSLVLKALQVQPPSNDTLLISYMGAGEPLMNVPGLINSALAIRDNVPGYKDIRFAVSTIIPGKKPFVQFMNEVIEHKLNFKLHWSLHLTTSQRRKSLMPSALDAKEGSELVKQYLEKTGNAVEIHYTLIEGVNDRQEDIVNLQSLVDRRMTIKLLKFAPHDQETMEGSRSTLVFQQKLEQSGFKTEAYAPPGNDIGAACGMFTLDQYTK